MFRWPGHFASNLETTWAGWQRHQLVRRQPDSGCEAYTAIAWAVSLSLERSISQGPRVFIMRGTASSCPSKGKASPTRRGTAEKSEQPKRNKDEGQLARFRKTALDHTQYRPSPWLRRRWLARRNLGLQEVQGSSEVSYHYVRSNARCGSMATQIGRCNHYGPLDNAHFRRCPQFAFQRLVKLRCE